MKTGKHKPIVCIGGSYLDVEGIRALIAQIPGYSEDSLFPISSLAEIGKLPQVKGLGYCVLLEGNKGPSLKRSYIKECFELFEGIPVLGVHLLPVENPVNLDMMEEGVYDCVPLKMLNPKSLEYILKNLQSRHLLHQYLREKVEQLRKVQRMDMLGRLGAGIAHDLNNVLEVVEGNATLLSKQLGKSSEHYRYVNEISKACSEASSLSSQLSAYSKNKRPLPQVLDLKSVLTELHGLLQRLAGAKVKVDFKSDLKVLPVQIDRSQFGQIAMNLVVNSRDACEQNGSIKIRLENSYVNKKYAEKYHFMRPGDYVLLSFEDNGKGMDEKTLSRIFEPFFTTKEQGKGTGLGLSTVYGIVKQYGGYIIAQSKPGKGTLFKIYFPGSLQAALDSNDDDEETSFLQAMGQQQEKTVLLVEDEESIRSLLKDTLEFEGYHVLEASGGDEAIENLSKFKGELDMLISDVYLDNTSGPELAAKLLEEKPQLKILYMSGFVRDMEILRSSNQEGYSFIQKPFPLKEFSKKVASILNS